MRNRLKRGAAVVGGAAVLIALGFASVAFACVNKTNRNKFDVRYPGNNTPTSGAATDVDGYQYATSGRPGDQLRAVGNNIDLAGHPHNINMIAEPWQGLNPDGISGDRTKTARCRDFGIRQAEVVAKSTNSANPLQRGSGQFDQQFTLVYAGLGVGSYAAHFCATPVASNSVLDKVYEIKYADPTNQQEGPYIYQPFTVSIV